MDNCSVQYLPIGEPLDANTPAKLEVSVMKRCSPTPLPTSNAASGRDCFPANNTPATAMTKPKSAYLQPPLLAMSTRSFPRFRDLPAELRLAIWSLCLPGPQVYEMDWPLSERHQAFPYGESCPRMLWVSRRGLVPVISHVCHEAREVALKAHRYVTGEDGQTDGDGASYPPWKECTANLPVRFRKGFDIVHLNWYIDYEMFGDWWRTRERPLASFQWLAGQAAAVSVTAELLFQFEFDPNYSNGYGRVSIDSEHIEYFSPHVRYYVVLAMVEIHLSKDEAVQAGVFGAFGEEPIRLVDPRDTAMVAKFRDTWRGSQSPSEEPDVAKFFSQAVDGAEGYAACVEAWRWSVEDEWILTKAFDLGVSSELRAEIFPHKHTEPNRQHPWVQEQLALMPRLEPCLMFRHCIGSCG